MGRTGDGSARRQGNLPHRAHRDQHAHPAEAGGPCSLDRRGHQHTVIDATTEGQGWLMPLWSRGQSDTPTGKDVLRGDRPGPGKAGGSSGNATAQSERLSYVTGKAQAMAISRRLETIRDAPGQVRRRRRFRAARRGQPSGRHSGRRTGSDRLAAAAAAAAGHRACGPMHRPPDGSRRHCIAAGPKNLPAQRASDHPAAVPAAAKWSWVASR